MNHDHVWIDVTTREDAWINHENSFLCECGATLREPRKVCPDVRNMDRANLLALAEEVEKLIRERVSRA